MPSDRARLSGDASRDYRALVFQQGRVTLEADTNEQVQLGETALREDIIDIIGPVGTPDDGYEVTASGGSFEIGTGTYYVGGWRLTLDDPLPLGKGPDELDLTPPAPVDGQYAIALLVTEQEVSAVEDRALREVALGGPDTAQRTRLMQRGVAIQTDGESCATSADAITKALEQQGAILDPATAAILPTARLQVIPVAPPTPADPCDPPASGGYLGADNQLIRVTVTTFDPATKQGKLLWGYDNASTLYRASTSDGKVLTLEGEPVDNDHAPRLGQAVEVLRTRALFSHGDVIAGDSGVVTKVAQPYDPDLNRVEIDATLPAGQRGDADHPLFLRLWEAEIAFTAGTQVELGETGLAVKIQLDALGDGSIVARPYWAFAARPSTPVVVYPRRYLDAGQPPEGPRQWLAPLAVVTGQKQGGEVTDDCRDTFLPLTKIRPGCCGITLSPEMEGHRDYIQNALDKLRGTRGIVSLRPGRYKLRKPIRLDASHKGLTLEGCSEGVFLEALNEDDPDFAAGLIVLDDVNEVYLRRLQFQMPASPLDPKLFGREEKDAAGVETEDDLNMLGSVAVSATGCAQLSIAECQFRYRMQDRRGLFAIGLLLRGECWGLKLTANRFLHDIDYEQERSAPRLMIGVALTPAVLFDAKAKQRGLASARLDALLDAADISGNEFVGLTQAILIYARLGYIRVERNRVLGCSGGITILESALAAVYHALASAIPMLVPLGIVSVLFQFAAVIPGAGEQDLDIPTADLQKSVREAQARGSQLAERLQIDLQGDGGLGGAISGLLGMAAAIELKYRPLTPTLHITGNDIDIFGNLSREPNPEEREERFYAARSLTSLPQANNLSRIAQLGGLQIAFEHRDMPGGDLLVSANRIATRTHRAVVIGLPHHLVFSGNLVRGEQKGDEEQALTVLADPDSAWLEIMGNVINVYAHIIPDQRPASPSQSWDFVNRTW